MKNLRSICFLIQGHTFLKSIFPLVVSSNSCGIEPIIFCLRFRQGKSYDNLSKQYIDNLLLSLKKQIKDYKIFWVDNLEQVRKIMGQIKCFDIFCQDANHHAKLLCSDKEIRVMSICMFFDTLHYANRINKKHSSIETSSIPDSMYFHDDFFEKKFTSLCSSFLFKKKVFTNPYFDQLNYLKKFENKKTISFFPASQKLISEKVQQELENYLDQCDASGCRVIIKQRKKDPWVFKFSNRNNNFLSISHEKGFPSTSLEIIANSDLVISSYSTVALESKFLNVPNINLDIGLEKLNNGVKCPLALSFLKNECFETFDNYNSRNHNNHSSISIVELAQFLMEKFPNQKKFESVKCRNSHVLLKDLISEKS